MGETLRKTQASLPGAGEKSVEENLKDRCGNKTESLWPHAYCVSMYSMSSVIERLMMCGCWWVSFRENFSLTTMHCYLSYFDAEWQQKLWLSVCVGERYSQYLWALTSPQSFTVVQLVVWQLFRHCLNIPALCERVRAYKAHLARCKQTDCGCVGSLLFSRSPEQYVNCATRVYHNILYPETLWLYNTSCAVWKTCVLISRRFLRRPSS